MMRSPERPGNNPSVDTESDIEKPKEELGSNVITAEREMVIKEYFNVVHGNTEELQGKLQSGKLTEAEKRIIRYWEHKNGPFLEESHFPEGKDEDFEEYPLQSDLRELYSEIDAKQTENIQSRIIQNVKEAGGTISSRQLRRTLSLTAHLSSANNVEDIDTSGIPEEKRGMFDPRDVGEIDDRATEGLKSLGD